MPISDIQHAEEPASFRSTVCRSHYADVLDRARVPQPHRPAAKSRPPVPSAARTTTQPDLKAGDSESGLSMSRGVVCRSIDGYESYEPLPDAALTSDEKLLVYYRPVRYKTNVVDGRYQAHLTQDAQIRKHGEKAVLRQKLKILDYKPTIPFPPQLIYLRNTISLKGLRPGDYDLTIILHDEIAKSSAVTQVVKFRVIPAQDPRKIDHAKRPGDNTRTP